jgi:hypothetical protein
MNYNNIWYYENINENENKNIPFSRGLSKELINANNEVLFVIYNYIINLNFRDICYGFLLIMLYFPIRNFITIFNIHFSVLLYLIITIHIFAMVFLRKNLLWKTRHILTSGIITYLILAIVYYQYL